jgi:hypothetical protein
LLAEGVAWSAQGISTVVNLMFFRPEKAEIYSRLLIFFLIFVRISVWLRYPEGSLRFPSSCVNTLFFSLLACLTTFLTERHTREFNEAYAYFLVAT